MNIKMLTKINYNYIYLIIDTLNFIIGNICCLDVTSSMLEQSFMLKTTRFKVAK